MNQLIILARAPELGQGKRRLANDIGDEEALAVYRALLGRCAQAVSGWQGAVSVHGAGDLRCFQDSALAEFDLKAQVDGSLAERMAAAFQHGLAAGPTLLIGSDCPGLLPEHLAEMEALLGRHHTVFGPAEDGGYWAIGAQSTDVVPICCDKSLPWSSEDLLRTSVDALKAHNGDIAFGVQLADCDTIEDLRAAQTAGFTYDSTVRTRPQTS